MKQDDELISGLIIMSVILPLALVEGVMKPCSMSNRRLTAKSTNSGATFFLPVVVVDVESSKFSRGGRNTQSAQTSW